MKPFSTLLAALMALCIATFHVAAFAAPAKDGATSKSAPGPTASKFDTKLPIEISSDKLVVMQHENKAIFTGNVVAVQGTVRLKSDVMIVHYQQKNNAQPTAAAAAPAPPPQPASAAAPAAANGAVQPSGPMGAITLIEVQGNVFVATPEESATGDHGDYVVATKIIHLFGDNVVLTREKDILRGTALEYNLNTGRSLLTNTNVPGKGPNGNRVRGVFLPSDDKPGEKKPAKTQNPPANPTAFSTPAGPNVTAPAAASH